MIENEVEDTTAGSQWYTILLVYLHVSPSSLSSHSTIIKAMSAK